MTYIKITELPSATGVTPDDIMVIVDDPGGTPLTRKITIENLAETIITEIDGGNIT
jgi:hypothetical protein